MNEIEGNKIIADFVGLRINWIQSNHYLDPIEYDMEIDVPDFLDHDTQLMYLYDCDKPDENFRFHSNWLWLMPVVEIIERIHDDFHGYFGVHICSNSCSIQGTNLRTDPENPHYAYFNESYGDDKIQATWLGVISFIKWWNEYNERENVIK
jgi:hypothetical protein